MNKVQTPQAVADPLSFTVEDVTGRRRLEVDGVDGHRAAGDIAASLASMFDLPTNEPYAIRDDARGAMLIDDRPLGSQLPQTGSRLVVIPRSHLG